MQKNSNTRKMVFIALMIALDIVLTRFSLVNLPTIRIGFGFLPTAIVGMIFGPLSAGISAVIADIIGINFFSPFPMHLGITLTAFLIGLTYGIFMYKRVGNNFRIVISVLIVTVVLGLGLNTYWIAGIRGVPFVALIPERAVQTMIMIPVQIVTLKIFSVHLPRLSHFLPIETGKKIPEETSDEA